jgi:predicted thioesterase
MRVWVSLEARYGLAAGEEEWKNIGTLTVFATSFFLFFVEMASSSLLSSALLFY